jgi:hypothetical protein
MGLLDFLKRKPGQDLGESTAVPAMDAISSAQMPMGPSGMGMQGNRPPGAPTMPTATPMFPQTKQMSPSSAFQSFSPTSELQEVQTSPSYQQAPMPTSNDLDKRMNHIEDKIEIMNEKLDLIMRELRNLYERGSR